MKIVLKSAFGINLKGLLKLRPGEQDVEVPEGLREELEKLAERGVLEMGGVAPAAKPAKKVTKKKAAAATDED